MDSVKLDERYRRKELGQDVWMVFNQSQGVRYWGGGGGVGIT
jgi:ABC-type antimicrobial peptide transport system ATPase subunit